MKMLTFGLIKDAVKYELDIHTNLTDERIERISDDTASKLVVLMQETKEACHETV